jgi:L-threonylcarbamoyladenylate synthase
MEPTRFPTKSEIEQAAAIIRLGGLVAFPTETVYGLGANALDSKAVQRIYTAKRRPASSPLIVHVSSVTMAKKLVSDWPERAEKLASRFWPGPLTLILPKNAQVPGEVTAGLPGVGIRMPAHPVAMQLIEAAGVPIAAPSANPFTKLSPTEARHVREGLGEAVECILDAGPTEVGIESTVLSLLGGESKILRPGMITADDIEAVIGPLSAPDLEAAGPHESPGMHRKHYSPATKVLVTDALPAARVAYVWWSRPRESAKSIRMPADPAQYARQLYAVLHRLDSESYEYIVVEPVPESHAWAGIRDRLKRASSESAT